MILLVVLVLSAEARSRAEKSTPDAEPSFVPAPTHLTFKSYNLNPVLHWEYQNITQTPVFTVQVKTYTKGRWIDACVNITHHYCSIFGQVDYPDRQLWARVKAQVGQKESGYVESEDLVLCQKSKIGPPRLHIRRWEDQLIVHIYHPVVEIDGEMWGTMYEDENTCHTFEYTVYLRTNRHEILETKHISREEDCNETLCQLSVMVPSLHAEYCVSADGFSKIWRITTEKSNEICFTVPNNSSSDAAWIPVAATSAAFLIVILALAYWWYIKKNPCKRKSIILPKSLISVVRNATSETKLESKYVSLITSCQPFVQENETMICEEQLSPAPTPNSPGKAEHRELSTETEVLTTEENISDMSPEGRSAPVQRENLFPSSSSQSEACSVTLNSYHSRNSSDSGHVGSDSFGSDSEFPPNQNAKIKSEEQESTAVRNAPSSFGYDKPHVLVNLVVDGEGQESLIGYRLAAESKELP